MVKRMLEIFNILFKEGESDWSIDYIDEIEK